MRSVRRFVVTPHPAHYQGRFCYLRSYTALLSNDNRTNRWPRAPTQRRLFGRQYSLFAVSVFVCGYFIRPSCVWAPSFRTSRPSPPKGRLTFTNGSATRESSAAARRSIRPVETRSRIRFCFRRWCVLFSHPSDFTPVCTTELGKMAVLVDEFKKRNVKLLGLSCDELKSHVDWINVTDSPTQYNCVCFYFRLRLIHRL